MKFLSKKIIWVFLFQLLPIFGFSQEEEINDLFKEINTLTVPDKKHAEKAVEKCEQLEKIIDEDKAGELSYLKGKNLTFLRNENAFRTMRKGLENNLTPDSTRLKLYHELAIAYVMLKNDYDSLEICLHKAENMLPLVNNNRIVAELYLDLSQLNWTKQKTEKARSYLNKIIEMKPKVDGLILSKVYGSLGDLYHQNNDIEQARKSFRKQIYLSKKLNMRKGMAIGYKSLSNTYIKRESPQIDSAYYFLTKAKVIFEEIDDKYSLRAINHDFFNYYRFTKQYNKAFSLIKIINVKNPQYMSQIAEVLYFHNSKNQSENLIKEALQKSKNTYDSAYIYQQIHYIYKQDSKYAKALDAFEKHSDLYNKIVNEKSKKETNELEIKYETAKKEAKIAEQKLENQKQKTYTYFALGAVAFLLLLGGSGYLYNWQKQKQKELKKQQELSTLQQNMTQLGLSNLNNQINSHDFKNTLTAALNEVQEKAPKSYQHICDLLQITESALYSDSYTDSLRNQFHQIKGLVDLTQNRLFEKVHLHIDNRIDEEVQIPRLLLKNLVENSLKHGIKGTGKDAEIIVSCSKKEDNFVINVKDSGKGLKKEQMNAGKGISVYQELFAYFNKRNERKAHFEIKNWENGARAIVKIPLDYRFV